MAVSTSSMAMTQKCTYLVRVFLLFQLVQAFSTHISVQFPRLCDAHRMSEQSSSMQACIAAWGQGFEKTCKLTMTAVHRVVVLFVTIWCNDKRELASSGSCSEGPHLEIEARQR
jgi:hypothetical protein